METIDFLLRNIYQHNPCLLPPVITLTRRKHQLHKCNSERCIDHHNLNCTYSYAEFMTCSLCSRPFGYYLVWRGKQECFQITDKKSFKQFTKPEETSYHETGGNINMILCLYEFSRETVQKKNKWAYTFSTEHHNHADIILEDHLPEIIGGFFHRWLGCNIWQGVWCLLNRKLKKR